MVDDKRIGRLIEALEWLVPSIAVGLFAGRLLSELLRPGLTGAILLALVLIISSSLVMRRLGLSQTWPSLFLLLYAIYPEPDPQAAAAVGLFTLIVALLYNYSGGKIGIALSSRSIIVAGVIGFFFVALYTNTLAVDVLPADSGELQLVATELGVAHPPGFPLYTIIANIFTRLPIGTTLALRVNLFSAVTSAATLGFIFLTVKELSKSTVGGVIAVIALGTATTFWAQATTANIRSLTGFFVSVAFFAFVRLWNLKRGSGISSNITASDINVDMRGPVVGYLLIFFLAITFGVSHHLSIVFIALVLILGLVLSRPNLLRTPVFWLVLVSSTLLALLPLIYLPLRAAAGAQGAPDDLNTLSGLINHVLALGFRGDFFYFSDPSLLWERLKVIVNVFAFQFSPVLLVGMLIGLILMAKRDWPLTLVFAGSLLFHTLISAMYRAPQTVEYMLPAYIPATILLGYGAGLAASKALEKDGGQGFNITSALSAVYVAALLTASLIQFTDRYNSFNYLHNDTSTRQYTETVFRDAPENSVVLADWHWATPMWYLQQVEGQRPDLDIHFVYPTNESYADTWARRIREELEDGQHVVATHYNETAYQNLHPSEPIGEAFLFGQDIRNSLPSGFRTLDLVLGDVIQLHGYQLSQEEIRLGEELKVTVAWELLSDEADITNLWGQIIDQHGQLLAADDQPIPKNLSGINLTQLRLIPRPGTIPGSFTFRIGAYGEDPLLAENSQTQVDILDVNILPSQFKPTTANSTYRILEASPDSRRLVGYDWDNTLANQVRLYLHWDSESGFYSETVDMADGSYTLPDYFGPWGIVVGDKVIENEDSDSHYLPFGQGIVWTDDMIEAELGPSPGQRIELTQNFVSTMPVLRDLIISIRLVGYEPDGFHWTWWDLDDTVPAMGGIPTLKWIAGSRIRDPHWTDLSETAEPDQEISPLLRIYDAFTGRAVPILDERISQQFPWVPLGTAEVEE